MLSDAPPALALNPEAIDLFGRSVRKAKSGDHRGALDDFTQAIALNPTDADFYVARGQAAMGLKQRAPPFAIVSPQA